MKFKLETFVPVVFLLGVAVGLLLNEVVGAKSDCAKLQQVLVDNTDMVEDIRDAVAERRARRCTKIKLDDYIDKKYR